MLLGWIIKIPFRERYRRIPPHQYEEVKNHLKEMLEIGAIRKSQSPWGQRGSAGPQKRWRTEILYRSS